MYIKKMTLQHFRNHQLTDLSFEAKPIIFYGANGSGKTNLLEAISYFTAGRGLRGARLCDLSQKNQKNDRVFPWASSLMLAHKDNGDGDIRLSSQYVQDKRINKIQSEPIKNAALFSEWLSVFWLTPSHDGLFVDSSKTRRKFLDRMVFSYDPHHAARLVDLETLMKERLKLLSTTRDTRWLDVLELKMAERSVDIGFARYETLQRIESASQNLCDIFPKFKCLLKDEMLLNLPSGTKNDLRDIYVKAFKKARHRDYEAHMTTIGVHRSDFTLAHLAKGEAQNCSTGEQKILLMGFVLSFLMSRLAWDDKLIVILLDECVSHFDFAHRVVLFEQILFLQNATHCKGSLHAFLTGTDRELFAPMEGKAMFYDLSSILHQKGKNPL